MRAILLLCALAACAPTYSPNVYSFDAAQQLAKVEHGVIEGLRPVQISPDTSDWAKEGVVVGGAGGMVVGDGLNGALGGIGGEAVGMGVGGALGAGIAHLQGDAKAWEYVVRLDSNTEISVAQSETPPLAIGTQVIILEGKQARIVADYVGKSNANK